MNETEEKKLIQIKQEKVCAEIKNLNDDIVCFKKEFERPVEKTKDLEEFKKVKIAEETDLEVKLDKCDKKLNYVTEREAKLGLWKRN